MKKMILTARNGRTFDTFPVAVCAFVFNLREECLLLKRPGGTGWEIPSGALEAGESPLDGLRRELREELGRAFRFRVLGPVWTASFRFDDRVGNMLSIGFAVRYLRGAVCPGDDMAGADWAWMSPNELRSRSDIRVPPDSAVFAEVLTWLGVKRRKRQNGRLAKQQGAKDTRKSYHGKRPD